MCSLMLICLEKERWDKKEGGGSMNLYECFPGGGGAYIRCPGYQFISPTDNVRQSVCVFKLWMDMKLLIESSIQ